MSEVHERVDTVVNGDGITAHVAIDVDVVVFDGVVKVHEETSTVGGDIYSVVDGVGTKVHKTRDILRNWNRVIFDLLGV